jgi:hypothetical protein
MLGFLPFKKGHLSLKKRFAMPGTELSSWGKDPESRGWTADVLGCVREIGRSVFSLADVYLFERRLSRLHQRNRNVRPKIRQQLQVLRDHGVLEFLGDGQYHVLLLPALKVD